MPELALWLSILCSRVYKSIPVLVLWFSTLCSRVYKSIPVLVLWFSTLCSRVYKSIPVLVLCLCPLCLWVYKSIPVLVLCLYPLCLWVYKSIHARWWGALCSCGYIKVYPCITHLNFTILQKKNTPDGNHPGYYIDSAVADYLLITQLQQRT